MSGRFVGTPPERPDVTASRPRWLLWGPIGVIVVAILAVGALAAIDTIRRPPHRTLPEPLHRSVLIIPIGDVPADQLAGLPGDYRAEYGLTIEVAPPIALPPAAYDSVRRQWVAQDLIAAIDAAHPEAALTGRVAIGITRSDIYIRGVDWNWAFALREQGRLAVVSTARMGDDRPFGRDPWPLLRKMLTRQVGFLCFGLRTTKDPGDVMYESILGVDDLVRIGDHL